MIGDVQPVPDLQPVAVEGQRLIVERVRDEQRDELLGVVVRAVRVRTAGDDGVEAVGDDVRPDEQLAGGLRGGVRGTRRERVGLDRATGLDRAVDLVGRDLEVADRPAGPGPFETGVEQDVDADDPGPQERLRVEDRPVDVRFRREVDHGIRVGDERTDGDGIGDVAADERQPGGLLGIVEDRSQVRLVAGVGERVEHRDPGPVAPSEHLADVARADEAGPAGDQEARAGAGPGPDRRSSVTSLDRVLGRMAAAARPRDPRPRTRPPEGGSAPSRHPSSDPRTPG